MDDYTLLVVLWVVCAVAAYFIAQSRGVKGAGGWALVGFLLGPIGLVLALIFAKPKVAR